MYTRLAPKVLFLLFTLFSFGLYSQGQLQLHLNKTVFTPGEQVWFTTYLFDEFEAPIQGEALVQVHLLNKEGGILKTGVFPLRQGSGFGNLLLDESWKNDYVFLAAQVLQNEEAAPLRDMVRLRLLTNPLSKEKPLGSEERFLWTPENGSVIAGQQNTLLFQLLRSPESQDDRRLDFYEDNQLLISDIKGTWQEMGHLTYYHDPAKSYKFLLVGAGKSPAYFPVIPAEKGSVGIRINNLETEEVLIELNSLTKDKNGELEVWFKGQSQLSRLDADPNKEVFRLPKASLPEGVIQLRYVVAGQTRGQNWFVNQWSKKAQPIQLKEASFEADSIRLVASAKTLSEGLRLSATVMTKESYDLSYQRDHSLKNQLGQVFPADYIPSFSKLPSRKKNAQIDQWVKLRASLIKALEAEMDPTTLLTGVPFKGQVQGLQSTEVKQVLIQSRNGVFALAPVGTDKRFSATLTPQSQDTLFATPLDARGKALVKSGCNIWMEPLSVPTYEEDWKKWIATYSLEEEPQEISFWPDNQIALDEVVVTSKAKAPVAFQIDALTEGRIITAEDEKNYPTLASYLRKLGFGVRVYEGRVIAMSRGGGPGKATGPVPVPVIVDGLPSDGTDIFQMSLSQIQSITYDSNRRQFISLWVKKSRRQPKTCTCLPEWGISAVDSFERYLPFYNPSYLQQFGTLLWEPQLPLEEEKELVLQFPKLDTQEYVLLIRGLDQKNKLIDLYIPISLP
ncbi:hypothetical protein [Aureicoccus marinus]|uniref:Macroglobulin domain-containing protein n=1 Tax=Aureicoccus marinus TaxID=754435 RepID=A0A2S7T908_9FLAO|nr:hypothetical protein [Aureicoccus marinus]PQJ15997.1 hypothetical protein BST99_09915 [Aureicoccus marinus]